MVGGLQVTSETGGSKQYEVSDVPFQKLGTITLQLKLGIKTQTATGE